MGIVESAEFLKYLNCNLFMTLMQKIHKKSIMGISEIVIQINK